MVLGGAHPHEGEACFSLIVCKLLEDIYLRFVKASIVTLLN